MASVHKTAQEGFIEGSYYEENRPSYTDELVDHVIQSLYLGSKHESEYDILELGAGTGKFTRKLLQQLLQPVRYLATEPLERFLETFKQLSPEVEVKQCDAVSIPLPDNSVQGPKDFVIRHFASISVIARLNEQEKKKALDSFRAVLDQNFEDEEEIVIPFRSEFYFVEKQI